MARVAPLVGMLLRTRQEADGRLMLRTNLSTRPFYNVRAVRAIIAGLSTVVVVWPRLYNVVAAGRG